jgi:hypothetical protein
MNPKDRSHRRRRSVASSQGAAKRRKIVSTGELLSDLVHPRFVKPGSPVKYEMPVKNGPLGRI